MPAWLARAQALATEPANDVSGLALVPPPPALPPRPIRPVDELVATFERLAEPTCGVDWVNRWTHAQCVAGTILEHARKLQKQPHVGLPRFWAWLTETANHAGDDAWRDGLEVCRAWVERHDLDVHPPAPEAKPWNPDAIPDPVLRWPDGRSLWHSLQRHYLMGPPAARAKSETPPLV